MPVLALVQPNPSPSLSHGENPAIQQHWICEKITKTSCTLWFNWNEYSNIVQSAKWDKKQRHNKHLYNRAQTWQTGILVRETRDKYLHWWVKQLYKLRLFCISIEFFLFTHSYLFNIDLLWSCTNIPRQQIYTGN